MPLSAVPDTASTGREAGPEPVADDAVLVVGPDRVSDTILAQSLLKALRRREPALAIDVLAPAWSAPLLERMPEVRRVLEAPPPSSGPGLPGHWRLGRTLRGEYRRAIVLPRPWVSAVVPYAAGIARRTGLAGAMRYGLLNDIRRPDGALTAVQRLVSLAAPDGAPLPQIEAPCFALKVAKVQATMQALNVQKSARRRVLALCPGAGYGPSRQWPTVHYAELGRRFGAEGWDIWLFGSAADAAVCAGVAATCKVVTNLAGLTTLEQAIDLMSLADAVVTNDSGLMHVAAALHRPQVALFGSSDPGVDAPLNPHHEVVSLGLSCSPCNKRECPLGTTACLVDMPVDQVATALYRVIA